MSQWILGQIYGFLLHKLFHSGTPSKSIKITIAPAQFFNTIVSVFMMAFLCIGWGGGSLNAS